MTDESQEAARLREELEKAKALNDRLGLALETSPSFARGAFSSDEAWQMFNLWWYEVRHDALQAAGRPPPVAPPRKDADPCPECGSQVDCAPGGGVKCSSPTCDWWFCY